MKNVGSADKIFRIVLGIGIGTWVIWAQNWWGLVGLVPLGTAFMGWCPAYFPFKFSTAKK